MIVSPGSVPSSNSLPSLVVQKPVNILKKVTGLGEVNPSVENPVFDKVSGAILGVRDKASETVKNIGLPSEVKELRSQVENLRAQLAAEEKARKRTERIADQTQQDLKKAKHGSASYIAPLEISSAADFPTMGSIGSTGSDGSRQGEKVDVAELVRKNKDLESLVDRLQKQLRGKEIEAIEAASLAGRAPLLGGARSNSKRLYDQPASLSERLRACCVVQ